MQTRKSQTDEYYPIVYQELQHLARRYMSRERIGHSLSPTALINEAYIELSTINGGAWQNREHFLGVAALAMRRVLSAYARSRRTAKRSGRDFSISIDDFQSVASATYEWDYDDLDRALTRLESESQELCQIAVCRFFGGMSVGEVSAFLDISPAMVKRRWTLTRAWLFREMTGQDES
jgi:RNA polymerase sigma-70 factor, ECF subfamily